MSTGKLVILDDRQDLLIEACVGRYGFSSETKLTTDWLMHFDTHAKNHTAILANPTILLDSRFHSVLVINGPNLNLLGTREPEIYGSETLETISQRCKNRIETTNCKLEFRQSNHEGEIVTWIQEASDIEVLILNAGAYTHTSIAIHDALKSFNGLIVELHISNPHRREPFRQQSFIKSIASSACLGLGPNGYEMILELISMEANVGS